MTKKAKIAERGSPEVDAFFRKAKKWPSAKQSKTRVARIEKSVPKILDGKGMID